MGGFEEEEMLSEEGGGPVIGAEGGEAGEGFDEVCVEGGFCFEVQESDLAGGSEVEFLNDYILPESVVLEVKGWGGLPQTTRSTGGSVRAK